MSFGLSSSESEEFTQQILEFSGEVNGQSPFTRQKSTRDACEVTESEVEKPKTQVNNEICGNRRTMKKFMHSILFLICCFSAVAYGIESQENCEITSPAGCDQHPDCPRDSHPAGENCPHSDPSPY